MSGQPRHPPLKPDIDVVEYLDGLAATGPASPSKVGRRLNASAIRICNNHLTTLQGLDRVLPHVLDDVSELTWLDASCNQLISIDEVITYFPKLQVKSPVFYALATQNFIIAQFLMSWRDSHNPIQVLYLHGNKISHLNDVVKLSKLENLSKLTLHGQLKAPTWCLPYNGRHWHAFIQSSRSTQSIAV